MDYEKAYKEALERAKSLIDKEGLTEGSYPNRNACEAIFPELAEIEDEKIRKGLIYFLQSPFIKERFTDEKVAPWIAYLEKQKENTEKEYVFRPLAGTDITTAAEQAIRRANEGDRLVLAFNGVYIPVRKGCDANKIVDIYFIENQKEQKPDIEICPHSIKSKSYSEQKSTEKQDYSGLTDLERAIHRGFLCAGVENVPVEIIKETAQDCLAHIEQKSTEWSVDDEIIRDSIIEYINSGNIYATSRVNMITWLESLRPQSHWKPSEEQMEALNTLLCRGDFSYIGQHSQLRGLYDKLKKL